MTMRPRQRRALGLGLPAVHAVSNPVRRGPILLATDGTSQTGGPVVAAQLLAARLDLPLEVVTVLEPLPTFTSAPDVIVPVDPAFDNSRREARETIVRDYVSRFAGGAAPSPVHVRFGNVATEIDRFAREVSATIIVMGAAPHQRFGHVIAGQRAAQVLHSAPCPVLSVPPMFSELPKVVVAAVDFGPSSIRAAQAALLVTAEDGTVVLTHVLPRAVRPKALNMVPDGDLTINAQALFDEVLGEIASSIPDGVSVETQIVNDDAIDGVLSMAAKTNAGLIAAGTHGRGPIARLFLGSVTETLLHSAEQAVLASPAPRRSDLSTSNAQIGRPSSAREQEWVAALDLFSDRNLGRVATLEIHDPNIGSYIAGRGFAFHGAMYDLAAHQVEIMLGDSCQPTRHLTRSVLYPDHVPIGYASCNDEVRGRHRAFWMNARRSSKTSPRQHETKQ